MRSQSRHAAREVKRKVSRFEDAGRAERVIVSHAGRLDHALEDILRIEEDSWKEEVGKSFTARPGLLRLYGAFAFEAARKGWMRLYLLYLDSQPVAYIYGVVFRNQYYALKTSYHGGYAHLAPGIVLFDHALRDAFAQGLTTFHLLGDDARWKREFSNDFEKQSTVCVYPHWTPRCAWCGLYNRRLKPLVEARWPSLIAAKRRAEAMFADR